MIIGRGWLTDPKNVEVTVQFSASLSDVVAIRDFLREQTPPPEYWPFGRFQGILTEVIDQVEKTAYTNAPDEKK